MIYHIEIDSDSRLQSSESKDSVTKALILSIIRNLKTNLLSTKFTNLLRTEILWHTT